MVCDVVLKLEWALVVWRPAIRRALIKDFKLIQCITYYYIARGKSNHFKMNHFFIT